MDIEVAAYRLTLAYRLTRLDELDPAYDMNGRREKYDERYAGLDWPETAETMVGVPRLLHIADSLQTAIKDGVPGGFAECGVWRGGASIMAAAVLEGTGRPVWVCDSFKGFPEPDPFHGCDRGSNLHNIEYLTVGLDEVKANFEKYKLLTEEVHFVEGYFSDSLPGPVGDLAYLRCDGDMYGSTWQTLAALYDHVSPGGMVLIDDWNIGGGLYPARNATIDYRAEHGITEPLVELKDACGAVYWQKGS
jgi:hypothetical protein